MLIQVCDTIINTEQVNYITEITDTLGDGKDKTRVSFINKDAIILPITLSDFIKTINYRALACRVTNTD